MDDEDRAEAEEARKIQTTETFAGLGSTAGEVGQKDSIMDILKTPGETMGIKLLKRMGWREGQGVGPMVKRVARLEGDQGIGHPATQQTHLFAPENSSMISFVKKTDRKGLGFEGEDRLADVNPIAGDAACQGREVEDDDCGAHFGTLSNGNKIKKKEQRRKSGFGVGILNDNGSDDEDPYAIGPQISYNRIIAGGKKKKKKPEASKPAANPLLNSKPVFISKKFGAAKVDTNFRRCHDGRLPLDGFLLSNDPDPSSSTIFEDGKYPPPKIPQDWVSAVTTSESSKAASGQSLSKSTSVATATKLSPKSRAALLGEASLPGKSVFDYLTPSARTRIASATKNDHLPPALSEASAHLPSHPKTLQSLVPPLAREVAQIALGRGTAGWMPYAEDLAKRTRYRTFLEIRASIRPEGTLPERVAGSSNDDWVKEMNEFAHAAQIFKPMTGAMANRFTSSSSAPRLASDNVIQEAADRSSGDTNFLTKPTGKAKTPAEEAAAVGMYGPLTRSVINFLPTRLLCKRFNIPPPEHAQVNPGNPQFTTDARQQPGDLPMAQPHSMTLPQKNLELVGRKDMDDLRMSGEGMGQSTEEVGIKSEENDAAAERFDQDKEEAVIVDPERNEALEKERPGEAVFRAIFGSDSEDD